MQKIEVGICRISVIRNSMYFSWITTSPLSTLSLGHTKLTKLERILSRISCSSSLHPHSIFLISQEIQHPKSYTPCVLVYIGIYVCVYIPMIFKKYMYFVKPTPFSKKYIYKYTHACTYRYTCVYMGVYTIFGKESFIKSMTHGFCQ